MAETRWYIIGRKLTPQAQQLLTLPQLGPGQGAFQEPLGKVARCRPQGGGLALDPVRGPQSVWAQLRRVVLLVGGPAPARLSGVDLDQLAPVVDAHQLVVQPDLHPAPRRTQGGGHVIFRAPMYRAFSPMLLQ